MQKESVRQVLVYSKQHSKKKLKRIFSVSKLYFAVVQQN